MRGAGRDGWVKIRASQAERAEWHAKVERERTRQVARIGTNLNQIARWTTAYALEPAAVELPARRQTPHSDRCRSLKIVEAMEPARERDCGTLPLAARRRRVHIEDPTADLLLLHDLEEASANDAFRRVP